MNKLVSLNGHSYAVEVAGQGTIPCLCIGIGSLMLRSLSMPFKELFTVYSVDLYFEAANKHREPSSLTMNTLALDVVKVIQVLGLNKPVIIAHSCFGILALEVAKLTPDLRGVILVASAPQWNAQSIAVTNEYFMAHAEPERIKNDQERKAKYALIKKPTDSEVSIERYIADSARYWADFNVTDEQIKALWKGTVIDDAMVNQFFEVILPNHDLSNNLEKVICPVILLAGEKDFDSIPLVQWQTYPRPNQFTLIDCGDVGHWPQLEARELFDESIGGWVQAYLSN